MNQNPNFEAGAKQLVKLLRSFPITAGNMAVNHFKDSFKSAAWDGQAWEKRKPNPFEPNAGSRALLVQSRALYRSIRRVEAGTGFVKVATDVPYAEIHNEGGTIIQKPTFRQRMFFSHASDKFFASKNTALGNQFAAMSTAKRLVIKIPKRQFMGNSDSLNAKIEKN
ncbi:MAG: phage virion morphogenesis protein [Bacteroidia bacterium]|nr:phage virion morphogenesis protein [Bacteroidia bacterium]